MLKKMLRKTSKDILEILIAEGEKSLSEITERIRLSKPAVSEHLKDLESIGILSKRKEKTETGIETLYSLKQFMLALILNPASRSVISIKSFSPFSPSLLLLEQIEENEFKEDLKKFLEAILKLKEKQKPSYIILFGSVARGEGTWKSDIDLCILHRNWNESDGPSKKQIEELISQVVMETMHNIKPHFFELLEFEEGNSLLLKEIKDSGFIIYGNIYGREHLWSQMKRYKNITL